MSLPPGFLDELRGRVSIADVAGRKVTWDQRKSNPGKGDWWAPCPFHQEKTASFHVEDRKGFYYCFGCHAKGDAIGFVMETENVPFMEAVEILAREAGMSMPARDPQAQAKIDRGNQLAQVMEAAVRYFRMQLASGRGADARAYLDGRGLPQATRDRFEMGFATDDRQGLFTHLTGKGIAAKDIVDAGLAAEPDGGGAPYDRFRGRIIFPIRDARGRCTALGGRAMDPNARAKYLNSPETVLFDKGRSLYNHAPAREAAGKTGRLIVAEGYMDVIALAQAGFDHAVAPLGTAITEHQLAMIWRMCDEPVLALDGDKAGLRAAERLIDVALPLLEPGKSLRFVVLPEGQDPDDLIKAHGPNAMQTLLDRAQPMVQMLWARETRGQVFDSPERRAALDARLREKLRAIRDPGLRRHYGEAVRDLREGLFQGNRGPQARGPGGAGPGGWRPTLPRGQATQGTRSSLLAQGETAPARLREALILAAAMRAPRAALSMETALERLPFSDPEMGKIRDALLAALDMDLGVLSAREAIHRSMSDTLGFDPMAYVMSLPPVRIHPHLRDGAEEALVAQTLAEDLEKHAAVLGAEADLSEAEEELGGLANESLTWRIQQASAARAKATRASVAGGGTEEEDRENLSKQLQKLLDDEVWVKKGR